MCWSFIINCIKYKDNKDTCFCNIHIDFCKYLLILRLRLIKQVKQAGIRATKDSWLGMKGASLFLSLIPVQVNKGRIHHLEINNYTKNIPTWAKEHSLEPGTKPNSSNLGLSHCSRKPHFLLPHHSEFDSHMTWKVLISYFYNFVPFYNGKLQTLNFINIHIKAMSHEDINSQVTSIW